MEASFARMKLQETKASMIYFNILEYLYFIVSQNHKKISNKT